MNAALFHIIPLSVCAGTGAWDFAVLYVVLLFADAVWSRA